ncbi:MULTISPECIES: hypothetical protein [Streptomyces]|uniref:hypothetical protein n=1 Tax=Streptomyces TaxID=1883 RepID=UPI0033B4CA77
MTLVVRVKLLPTPVQVAALGGDRARLQRSGDLSQPPAFEKDVKNNFAPRRRAYGEVKSRSATSIGRAP